VTFYCGTTGGTGLLAGWLAVGTALNASRRMQHAGQHGGHKRQK
jgi:hypothetical protein